jgi:hypothetical protein
LQFHLLRLQPTVCPYPSQTYLIGREALTLQAHVLCLSETTVTESTETTVGNLFKSFKEAPSKLLSRFGVSAPEEIEMDSVEVNIFENPMAMPVVL